MAAGDGRRDRLVELTYLFLHRGELNRDPLFKGSKGNQYNLSDAKPHFEVVESAGGLLVGARRNAENGNYYWRITQWVMPAFTMIPPRADHPVHGHFWIPIDDDSCWAWSFDYRATKPLSPRAAPGHAGWQGHPCPNTCRKRSARSPTKTTIT